MLDTVLDMAAVLIPQARSFRDRYCFTFALHNITLTHSIKFNYYTNESLLFRSAAVCCMHTVQQHRKSFTEI